MIQGEEYIGVAIMLIFLAFTILSLVYCSAILWQWWKESKSPTTKELQ